MAATIAGVFKPELQNLVLNSNVLLVGAGGIGCEVLKNLVMMGFCFVDLIDMDTIEVSNLNRQFLFNKESVGKPKSHVAKTSVLKFNPNVNITSHFGDIMDAKYGVAFFKKFKLVINALDNKKARSHVNRMCLSCQIPLIESGTMGYQGQVEFILKGVSMCYECNARSEPKSYPMCTIRNTPKEPIHCIIWAKYLFGQLFGDSEEDVSMEQEELVQGGFENLSARNWAIKNEYNPKKLLKKIFFDDIRYLLRMSHLYAGKNLKPVLLKKKLLEQEYCEYNHVLDNEILTLEQSVSMFIDSVTVIKEKWEESNVKCLTWDKDDDDFMSFVVSCSNIRSAIFNIPFKSYFDIKSMAGNIIPAIATANAMVAGQIVIHALRILQGKYDRCQNVFLRSMPNHKGGLLVKDKEVQKPSPKCNVCSSDGEIILVTDIEKLTVRQLDELVLKKKLNMVAPDVTILNRVIISSDADDEVNMYHLTLLEAGITDGSSFEVDDDLQNYSIKIKVQHQVKLEEEDPDFKIFNNINEYYAAIEFKINVEPNETNDDCVIEEKTVDSAGSGVCVNNEDIEGADGIGNNESVKDINNEESAEGISNNEGAEDINNEESAEDINNKKGAEDINNEEGAEDINNEEGAEDINNEEGAEDINNEEGADDINNEEGAEDINNEEGAEDINNEEGAEEILAIKRKAAEEIEDMNDVKKSRVD